MKDKEFYLYMFDGDNVKIGITSNLERRERQIQYATGDARGFIAYYAGPFTYKQAAILEKLAHERFAHARIYGEWFYAEEMPYEAAIKFFEDAPKFFSKEASDNA